MPGASTILRTHLTDRSVSPGPADLSARRPALILGKFRPEIHNSLEVRVWQKSA